MGIISAGLGLASAVVGKKSADKAAGQSLTGFNYLSGQWGVNQAERQSGFAGQQIQGLLGLGTGQAAAEKAFENYRDSTGYQFRMDEGMSAITGSNAAKGLLNSGATLKGLQSYGQNMASSEFGNYMNQLRASQDTGLNASYNTASQGTSGGSGAAAYTRQGATDMATGLSTALGGAYDIYKNGTGL